MTIKVRVHATKRMESAGRAGWQERLVLILEHFEFDMFM